MKLSKKERSYIYDRVKWYGYNLGSTKDFIVKLYFFEGDDYSADENDKPVAYYSGMNRLFNILADRGISYKEYNDPDDYFYVEFSSKEIFKYIKYDINRGKKKKKLTPLERRLERESANRLKEFFKIDSSKELEDIQPFIPGRVIYAGESDPFEDLGIEFTPYEEVDTKNNSIVKRIVDNVSKELEKIKDKYFPHETDENDPVKKLYRGEATEEEKEEIYNNIHKEYHIRGNIIMGDNYTDEEGNPESADVKVKMNPEDVMLAYIKGLAEFRKRQTGEDIRVVNEEGEEL